MCLYIMTALWIPSMRMYELGPVLGKSRYPYQL